MITYWLVEFQGGFGIFYVTIYSLAMASTALGVLLGSSVEDPKLAQEFLPLLFVPQLLFAGFFVTAGLIPIWLRWARYLCVLVYAIRILIISEFENCAATEKNCRMVIANVDANANDTWWYWLVLVLLFVVFRGSALFVLRKKATKFY